MISKTRPDLGEAAVPERRLRAATLVYEAHGAITGFAAALAALWLLGSYEDWYEDQTLLTNARVHMGGAIVALGAMAAVIGARRRGLLIALAGAAAVAVPIAGVATAPVGHAGDGLALRVFAFNVHERNGRGAEIVEHVIEGDFDLLVLSESEALHARRAELEAVLPHRFGCEAAEACGVTIYSRHPLVDAADMSPPHAPDRLLRATVRTPAGDVLLFGVHLSKGFFAHHKRREASLVADAAESWSGPVVIAGDFNAAPWSPELWNLARRTEARFAARLVGTWPARAGPLGLPIDHVMASAPLAFAAYGPGERRLGSNHRAVATTLVWPATADRRP